MPLQLGAAFAPRVVVEHVEHPQITIESLRAEQLLTAIGALREALATMPAPVVNVAEPDLTAIVQAVTQIKGPATADEIAAAVAQQITPGGEPEMEGVLTELVAALKTLDFRLKGIGSSSTGGGGLATRIQNVADTSLDTREAALDSRYEWQDVSGTAKPLYVGQATPGTATSSALWAVQKYTWVAAPVGTDPVPSQILTRVGAWDSRITLF